MRRLKNATIVLFMGLVTLFAVVGCTEEQIRQVDQTVADANNLVSGGAALLQSPAGAMLPPDLRLYGTVGIAIASIVFNSWQKVRSNLMAKTTKAIIKGVDAAEKVTKTNPTNPIKVAIRQEMIAAGIYDKGNKLVDQLKVAR